MNRPVLFKSISKSVSLCSLLFIVTILIFTLIPFASAVSDTPDTYNIPRSFNLGKNYYNVYGSPDLHATIVGSNEFERGQTATLNLDVMNRGKLLGFENDRTPSGANEIYAAQTEMKLESSIVDATGVVATLSVPKESPIEIKSISQQIGSIKSGENAVLPARFDIEIDQNSKAGEYPLYLNLTYDYQKNVQVTNANASAQTYDINRWYGTMAQNQTLIIKIKNQANFEIVNTTGSLYPGGDNIIEIAIKNTGEEEARNVRAIANPSDPLSTTDDMAFLSDMAPGDTAVAKIKIKADSEAIPKVYSVDTVLRYETPEGNINYSDTLQAPVEVQEAGFFQRLFGWFN